MFVDRSANMRKFTVISIILCCLLLVSCSNDKQSAAKQFEKDLAPAEAKQEDVEKVMDSIQLKQIEQLSNTDTTDKNKKDFEILQKDMHRHLLPTFEKYEKLAKSTPAKTKEAKALKKDYLATVKQKRAKINELMDFIELCNKSIKANEEILDYTKVFEKKRSNVEEDIKNAQNQEDAKQLTLKLENNNEDLKNAAKKYLNNSQKAHPEDEVDRHIIPLIKKQILDINQTNITDKNVNSARKNAIEMYYSLQNYYETRVTTIKLSNQIKKINVEQLPKEGKDLSKLDDDYYQRLKQKQH